MTTPGYGGGLRRVARMNERLSRRFFHSFWRNATGFSHADLASAAERIVDLGHRPARCFLTPSGVALPWTLVIPKARRSGLSGTLAVR